MSGRGDSEGNRVRSGLDHLYERMRRKKGDLFGGGDLWMCQRPGMGEKPQRVYGAILYETPQCEIWNLSWPLLVFR